MPCGDIRDSLNRTSERQKRLIDEQDDKIRRLTRVCCDLRTILRRRGKESDLTNETIEWIVEHDKADAERIKDQQRRGEREKVKQAALDKLTMDERRILGL